MCFVHSFVFATNLDWLKGALISGARESANYTLFEQGDVRTNDFSFWGCA